MERFGNSALHFPLSRRSDNADGLSRQSVAKTDLSTIASATVEADTCRKYVVPICLGGGGSLFCGLKPLAFSLQPLAFLRAFASTLRNVVNQLQSLLCATKSTNSNRCCMQYERANLKK
jgi:hypothetical protein